MAAVAALPACSNEPPPPELVGSPPAAPRFERRIHRYFAGLKEQATVVKSERSVRVERADGTLALLPEVERADAAAWRERHGAATVELVQRLAEAAPSERLRFAIAFDSLADREDLATRLRSDDEEVALAARDEHAAIVAEMGAPIRAAAEAQGATVVGGAKHAPLLFAEGIPAAIEAIAHVDGVASVMDDPVGQAQDHASSPAAVHAVSGFGSGTTGTGRKIGMVEGGKCLIRASNYLVNADTTTTYQNPSAGVCLTSSQCTGCGGGVHTCFGSRCRDGHATAVASVVGQMAPDATLFISNDALDTNDLCTRPKTAAALDFFVDNGVKFVNQSYGCTEPNTDGEIQDYYARVHGLFITKSSGNANAPSFASDDSNACRRTRNSVCVGATTSDASKRACYSVWRNPAWLVSTEDREEPDVMAFGGESSLVNHYERDDVGGDLVALAGTASDVAVISDHGTSFAAPAVAALAALTQEYCSELLIRYAPDALTLRSWIRTAAFPGNPVGWKYSTLQHVFPYSGVQDRVGKDHEDGGGFANGTALKKLCSTTPRDEEVFRGREQMKRLDGQPATGSPDATPSFPDVPPGEQNLKQPLDQSLAPQPGLSGYRYKVLLTETLEVGDRFRFTFSWNYCNIAASTGTTGARAVDFDIFLYNVDRGEGLYASQTADDVNEGFDVLIPEGWTGEYQVLLYWPDDADFCEAGDVENTAWTGWLKRAAP